MRRLFPVAMLCAALAGGGCAQYEEYEYQPDHEMKPGAGLFTGERGAWVLLGDDKSDTGDDGESSTQEQTRRDEPESKSNRPLKIRGRRKR